MFDLLTRLKWWLMAPWILYALLLGAAPAAAQVTGPSFVFQAGTVINPDEVNDNFATVYDAAVNRFGGTIAGHLLWSPDGTFDIGASGTSRPRDLFLQRDATIGGGVTATALASSGNTTVGGTLGVTGATTLAALGATTGTFSGALSATTLTLSNAGVSAIDVAGGINAGTGNVGIIGTDGRIPALSSTYFASLSGTSLTGVALLGSANAFTSTSTSNFAGSIVVGDGLAARSLNVNGTSSGAALLLSAASSAIASFATASGNTFIDYAGTLSWRSGLSGTVRTTLDANGFFTHAGAFATSASINASTLAGGENHNYAPSGIGATVMVRVAGNAISASKITGITGGVAGRELDFCNTGTDLWSFKPEDSDSTAANRIAGELSSEYVVNPETCATLKYDGVSSRWRVKAGAQPMSPL